jgi:hypothetical protein
MEETLSMAGRLSGRPHRQFVLVAFALGLIACGGPGGDDDDSVIANCATDDLFTATACDETYCGPASTRLGTGQGGYHILQDDDGVPIVQGSQGGYHIDITVEMDNFCPIVFIRPSMWLDPGDGGELISIFDQNRHVQAVRVEPEDSPLQHFWGIRGFVPCEYWPWTMDPKEPQTGPVCGVDQAIAGNLQDFALEIRIEVEDHNGRMASDSKRVQPYWGD